jgi:magnesium chelatase accessory protein
MLDWEAERRAWPMSAHSHFMEAAGVRWHVQSVGDGPPVVLLHGTGASTHTWRGLWPLLQPHTALLAVDLPGHGFSRMLPGMEAQRLSLPGMATGLRALLTARGVRPRAWVGHSAGAAVAVQSVLDDPALAAPIVSVNGALLPWHGLAGWLFSPLARVMAAARWPAQWFALQARRPQRVHRLIAQTGSRLDAQGEAFYQTLVSDPDHAAAALSMMARWDLHTLERRLPTLHAPLTLLAAPGDAAVPPWVARRVHTLLPSSQHVVLETGGHLVHEEAPQAVAPWVLEAAGINRPS